ncbi:MAG TPA: cell envelope integrity protein CreD [Chitinophagaceae bacterium]|jgi:inner membrane protein|nr:cell envelope integrity protein CreD [Chitinophagaceae bacterium]
MSDTILEQAWIKSKVLIKGLIIGVLVLLLLIPAYHVEHLIAEREARQKEAVREVSSRWASRQIVSGPVLVLPYLQQGSGSGTSKQYAYFLPDELSVQGVIRPEQRTRGIYTVMLYGTDLQLSGAFRNVPLEKLQIDPLLVRWNEAFVYLPLSDARGLQDEIHLQWNGRDLTLSPELNGVIQEGALAAPLSLNGPADLQQIRFSGRFSLKGSEQILFTPVGRTTRVDLQGRWPHPSFTGSLLPDHDIHSDSFRAGWKSGAHARTFPQQWKGGANGSMDHTVRGRLAAGSFGVNLFVPVNGYQKVMRSVKYAVLCILLTFAAFFLMDTIHKKSVHPFQYGLIGLALVLFYVLLLSFTEYTGFDTAYAIAGSATIGLIAWFVRGLLASGRLTALLSLVLLFVYGYVFTILQLQDYALLLGSVGLFLTLALVMHFSRRIQW